MKRWIFGIAFFLSFLSALSLVSAQVLDPLKCNETDNGINYYLKSTNWWESSIDHTTHNATEECLTSEILSEFYCKDNERAGTLYNCSQNYGECYDGACANCTFDSDGGNEPTKIGSVTLGNGSIVTDFCIDNTHLEEYLCSNNEFMKYSFNCPVCKEGQCLYCTDSDGGRNYSVKGAVKVNYPVGQITSYTDRCDGSTFTEYYCENGSMQYEILSCSPPCAMESGICLNPCIPKTCQEQNCGTIDNGCGGSLNCGSCTIASYFCGNGTCRDRMRTTIFRTDNDPGNHNWAGIGEGNDLNLDDYTTMVSFDQTFNRESWVMQISKVEAEISGTGDYTKVKPVLIHDLNKNGIYDSSDEFLAYGQFTNNPMRFVFNLNDFTLAIPEDYERTVLLIAYGMKGPFNIGDTYTLNVSSIRATIADPTEYFYLQGFRAGDPVIVEIDRWREKPINTVTIIAGQQHWHNASAPSQPPIQPAPSSPPSGEKGGEEANDTVKPEYDVTVVGGEDKKSKFEWDNIKSNLVWIIFGALIIGVVIGAIVLSIINKNARRNVIRKKR